MIAIEGGARVLYQWELNRRVVIDGFEPGTVVEFSHKNDFKNSSVPVKSYEEDGHTVANVPNSLLQLPGYIRVFVRPSAGDVVNQPEQKDFRVIEKEKPEDYDATYSETEVFSYKELEERVEALEKGAGTTGSGPVITVQGETLVITGGQ